MCWLKFYLTSWIGTENNAISLPSKAAMKNKKKLKNPVDPKSCPLVSTLRSRLQSNDVNTLTESPMFVYDKHCRHFWQAFCEDFPLPSYTIWIKSINVAVHTYACTDLHNNICIFRKTWADTHLRKYRQHVETPKAVTQVCMHMLL